MIGAIMILAVVAYLVWTFWGRAFHVIGQYKKGGSQFKLSEPLDYEAIYQKLKEGLQYPDNRNLFYDEFGQPSIAGRYGTYTIHTEDTLLTVQAETNDKLNKNMRQTEEGTQERVDFQGNCTYSGERYRFALCLASTGIRSR